MSFRLLSYVRWGILLLACAGVRAETRVGGIIDGEQRWTPEESPYIVTRDILITGRGRLTIAPGTAVRVGKLVYYDDTIPQLDHLDSQLVAIKVEGVLRCIGRRQNRISFSSAFELSNQCVWYGLNVDERYGRLTEIAFADISGACNGITVRRGETVIRNSVVELNNVGVRCIDRGNARLYNCVVSRNFTTGILVRESNPTILNSIVAFNKTNGVWCDGLSHSAFKHNCVYDNGDGNFLECDPKLGGLSTVSKNGDSTDTYGNIFMDPVFAGSPGDSLARTRDLTRSASQAQPPDSSLAAIDQRDSSANASPARPARRGDTRQYWLSSYSPCRDAGSPQKRFRDADGSRNDIGIYGGPEFLEID